MNYSINIKGIHCSGCVGLIKISLEELNLSEVVVNQDENKANFKAKPCFSFLTFNQNKSRFIKLLSVGKKAIKKTPAKIIKIPNED
jgi:copper chaperone CopZ